MNTSSATVTRPAYLTREELAAAKAAGYRYRVTNAPARLGLTPRTSSVERLFDALPADGSVAAAWMGFGHVHGVEHFSFHLMRRSTDGTRIEVMESGRGTVVIAYPLGQARTVRTLVQSAR